MPHPNANGRVLIVWLIKLIKAATNVRRGLPEWASETITLPPGSPILLARHEPDRLVVTIRELTGQPAMLSPVRPSTMSGQGACLLRAFGERRLRTTGDIYAVSTTGTIVDVTRS